VSSGLERARGCLAAAAGEAEAACRAWGVWADEVRERAERRLGAGPCEPRACLDREYAAALDAGRPFIEAARVLAALLAVCEDKAVWLAPGDLPGPGFPDPGTAIGSPHS
jgi:hypothetical protein